MWTEPNEPINELRNTEREMSRARHSWFNKIYIVFPPICNRCICIIRDCRLYSHHQAPRFVFASSDTAELLWKWGEGGGRLTSDLEWRRLGGGRGSENTFLVTLYNFQKSGGGGLGDTPSPSPSPSADPDHFYFMLVLCAYLFYCSLVFSVCFVFLFFFLLTASIFINQTMVGLQTRTVILLVDSHALTNKLQICL